MQFASTLKSFLFLAIFAFTVSCHPGPQTLRVAEVINPTDQMALKAEIVRNLLEHGLGYQIKFVASSNNVDDLIANKLDIALFAQDAADKGVPSQCSSVSNIAASLGQSGDNEKVTTVISCGLSASAKEAFDLMSQLKFNEDDIEDAMFWKEDNKASNAQAALYFLLNNQLKWKKLVPDSGYQNIKSVISKESESSKLQF